MKDCRREEILKDPMIKNYHRVILINKVCGLCSNFNCKHSVPNYYIFLRALVNSGILNPDIIKSNPRIETPLLETLTFSKKEGIIWETKNHTEKLLRLYLLKQ